MVRPISSIATEVKIAILETDGDNDSDPTSLPNDKAMADFSFSDIQYIDLADEFKKIAKKRNKRAKISLSRVMDCELVKDCIDLVTEASKV